MGTICVFPFHADVFRKMTSLPPSRFFPPAESADAEGVVGFGGKLTPEWLLDAYQHGIFPWPTGDPSLPVPWCSPDPRAIFELDHFHVPRRLAQTCRSGKFRVTFDTDFSGVIRGCATSGMRRGQTWLTPPMIRAYTQLFELGHWPQRRSLARRSIGRGNLWPGNRRVVRCGIDVLSRPRRLESGPGASCRATSSSRVHAHGHPAAYAAHCTIWGN